MLEVQVLGPLAVRLADVPLKLGTPKQQVVLAMLAVRAGQVINLDELIDELWPQAPPASAVANARGYAANLRRLFDAAIPGRNLLVRSNSGYRLLVDSDEVDLFRFIAESGQGRDEAVRGDLTRASNLLASAASRWRGHMLAGLPLGPSLAAKCAVAEEERLTLIEDRSELELLMRRPRSAIGLLSDHVQAHPLRERAQLLLMYARYDGGDVTGALAAYARARSALINQLGIEPGTQLRRLHRAVLERASVPPLAELNGAFDNPVREQANPRPAAAIAADQVLRPAPAGAPEAAGPGLTQPVNWLPRAVTNFTGRRSVVSYLLKMADHPGPGPSAVHVIDGMAGSGKTALAVHVASQLAGRFPDAQLFIDLQGHSEGRPVEPPAALVTLLRQLGVPANRIPSEFDHRVALWRTEVATRRVIVVLDNAASSEQVEPLLPAAPGSLVLVTSRRRLVTFDGVPPQSLPLLTEGEAVELLARVASPERVLAERGAAAEVARACGYLPLAIRLAAARLAHRPGWRVADLARRLGQESPVLPELVVEDRSVADAFGLSYEPLREPVKRMFRLLGLYPGGSFDVVTAAALADIPPFNAESIVQELVDRHLVEEIGPGRFRLHDLIREYSRGLTAVTDPPAERYAAIGRMLDRYLHAAAAATAPLEIPAIRNRLRLKPPARPELLVWLDKVEIGWLESERPHLSALVRTASDIGHYDLSWQLARAVWRFYYVRGYFDDIIATHLSGLHAAQKLGNDSATATMHNYLASAYARTGKIKLAFEHLKAAIEFYSRAGDKQGAGICRANLAVVFWLLGRLDEAVELNQRALDELRGTATANPLALVNLGIVLTCLGKYSRALWCHRVHLQTSCERGDGYHVARALVHIGSVRVRLGQYPQAIRLIKAGLAQQLRSGNRYGEAESLNDLGTAYRNMGQLAEAERRHRAAIVAVKSSGELHVEAAAMNDLGLTVAAAGRRDEAVRMHEQALALAARIGHPYEQGRALDGIARCVDADDPAQARRYWERALAIFKKMGVPERGEVERRLAALPEPHSSSRCAAAETPRGRS